MHLYKVHSHLIARFMIAALFIEGNILFAAIENHLVASSLLGDVRENFDDSLTQAFGLTVLVNDDILNVSTRAAASQEFELDKHGTACDDLVGVCVDEDDRVVCVGRRELEGELLGPRGEADVRGLREVGENAKVSAVVVVAGERSDDDVFG